ncbi:MAG TPA: hypothetical protein VKI64_09645 [Acidimicrobiales bacterium]|nr:hypothetical protein [Acidimicrobiales bacterium]
MREPVFGVITDEYHFAVCGRACPKLLAPFVLLSVPVVLAGRPLEAAPHSPAPVLRARPAVDLSEHVPAPTALLVPVAAGLAVLVSVTLGPVGRPSRNFRREGGLSRAPAHRSPGGREAGLRPWP